MHINGGAWLLQRTVILRKPTFGFVHEPLGRLACKVGVSLYMDIPIWKYPQNIPIQGYRMRDREAMRRDEGERKGDGVLRIRIRGLGGKGRGREMEKQGREERDWKGAGGKEGRTARMAAMSRNNNLLHGFPPTHTWLSIISACKNLQSDAVSPNKSCETE